MTRDMASIWFCFSLSWFCPWNPASIVWGSPGHVERPQETWRKICRGLLGKVFSLLINILGTDGRSSSSSCDAWKLLWPSCYQPTHRVGQLSENGREKNWSAEIPCLESFPLISGFPDMWDDKLSQRYCTLSWSFLLPVAENIITDPEFAPWCLWSIPAFSVCSGD